MAEHSRKYNNLDSRSSPAALEQDGAEAKVVVTTDLDGTIEGVGDPLMILQPNLSLCNFSSLPDPRPNSRQQHKKF